MTIDGDLQDDPAEIPRLLAELEAGADLVSAGSATGRNRPASGRVAGLQRGHVAHVRRGAARPELRVKAYRSEVVESLALTGDQYRYIPVLAAAEGFRVSEIPVDHRPRAHGAASTASSATCAASSTS